MASDYLVIDGRELNEFMRQATLEGFKHGPGRYDTETVCECLTCSVAIRSQQVQKAVGLSTRTASGHLRKKGALYIESGAFKGCYVCAPCKKAIGSEVLELVLVPETTNPPTMSAVLENTRNKLLNLTMMRITQGYIDRKELLMRALKSNLLGGFTQSAGLPAHAYDYARLQRLFGLIDAEVETAKDE